MKILVTGATGFIGTHLVKALVEKGRDVSCLVRKTSNTNKIETLGVKLIYGDLLDKDSLEGAVEGIDIIYHLAGIVYTPKVKEYRINNVDGTKNLLKACHSREIIKFIYLSSIAAVGGNQSREILLNEDSPCYPITPYGRSKFTAEQLLLEAFNIHKMPIVIIRPPIVYGPTQPHFITRFFSMIKEGKFAIIGDGNNIKSFCYVDNLVQGLLLAEESQKSVGRVYFISDSEIYTLNEIVQTIASEEGVAIAKKHFPLFISPLSGYLLMVLEKIFGMYSTSLYATKMMGVDLGCDISRAEKELDYYPRISFQEGIIRTIQWCKKEALLRN